MNTITSNPSSSLIVQIETTQTDDIYQTIAYKIEKISALCRLVGLDPQQCFLKGKLPSLDQCARCLQVIYNYKHKYESTVEKIQEHVEILEQMIIDLPLGHDMEGAYQKAYLSIQNNQPIPDSNYGVAFVAHIALQQVMSHYSMRAITPFCIGSINAHLKSIPKWNQNLLQAIETNERFVESKSEQETSLDYLIYGTLMTLVFSMSDCIINHEEVNKALFALFLTPQVAGTIISSQFFNQVKGYIIESTTQLFQKELNNCIYQKELDKLQSKSGINTLLSLKNNPKKVIISITHPLKTFFVSSFKETRQTIKQLKQTCQFFYKKSSNNLLSISGDTIGESAKYQWTLNQELTKNLTSTILQKYKRLEANYQSLITRPSSQYMTHYELLFKTYSPQWELHKYIFPKEFLFLSLANANSTNGELLIRGLITGLIFFSQKEGSLSVPTIVLLSALIQTIAAQFPGNQSIMNVFNQKVAAVGEKTRFYLEDATIHLYQSLQDKFGLNESQSEGALQFIKELMFASPMLLLSILSDENYAYRWLLWYNPLENDLSNLGKKWGYQDGLEIHPKGSIISIAYNTILYQLVVGAFLTMLPSSMHANILAILSQMPSIKNPAVQWMNQKAAPLIRQAIHHCTPEWGPWYDAITKKVSIYTKFSGLIDQLSPIVSMIWSYAHAPSLSIHLLTQKCIRVGRDHLTSLGKQAAITASARNTIPYLKKGWEWISNNDSETVRTIAKKTTELAQNSFQPLCASISASVLYYSLPTINDMTNFSLIENSLEQSLKGAICTTMITPPSRHPDPNARKKALLAIFGITFALQFMITLFQKRNVSSELDSSYQLNAVEFLPLCFIINVMMHLF